MIIDVKIGEQEFIGGGVWRVIARATWKDILGVESWYQELIREYDRGGNIEFESTMTIAEFFYRAKKHIETQK